MSAPHRGLVPILAVLVLLGVALRIGYSVAFENGNTHIGDPLFFLQTAASLSHGHGYAVDFPGTRQLAPTALHPPMFPIVLALLDLVRPQSAGAHRIALASISATCVVAMGLLWAFHRPGRVTPRGDGRASSGELGDESIVELTLKGPHRTDRGP